MAAAGAFVVGSLEPHVHGRVVASLHPFDIYLPAAQRPPGLVSDQAAQALFSFGSGGLMGWTSPPSVRSRTGSISLHPSPVRRTRCARTTPRPWTPTTRRRSRWPLPSRPQDVQPVTATADVQWAPPGGTVRPVPACAAHTARVNAGEAPDTRMVATDQGPQPYWNAGLAYAPWAGGYFGVTGGVLGGLLVGTMLGSLLSTPEAFAASDIPGPELPRGGEVTGSDFNTSDFSGGFGGGYGGDSAGDFGGGDW